MPEVTVVYWRDIPAQVLVGRGRRAAKRPLSERFEQAIDRAAMKAGLAGTDDYLAQWRKAPLAVETPPDAAAGDQEVAKAAAARIEADYDQARLRALIDNAGWAGAASDAASDHGRP